VQLPRTAALHATNHVSNPRARSRRLMDVEHSEGQKWKMNGEEIDYR
jgi:hypothetical protein